MLPIGKLSQSDSTHHLEGHQFFEKMNWCKLYLGHLRRYHFIFVPFNCPPKCPWEIFYISDFTTSPIKVHMGSVQRTILLRKNIFVTNLRQTSHQIHYFPFRSKWNYVDLHENITLFLMPTYFYYLLFVTVSLNRFIIIQFLKIPICEFQHYIFTVSSVLTDWKIIETP